jgi:heat shock protein HslJ
MRRTASRALVFALALAIAACESAVSDDNAGNDAQLTQKDWVAQSIAGKPVVQIGRVTLSFGEGRVSGRGGCNLYSGQVEYGRGTIRIGPLISTKMACVEGGLMQQESAYLSTLQGAERYAVGSDGKLTIATKTGAIVYEGAPRQVRPEN